MTDLLAATSRVICISLDTSVNSATYADHLRENIVAKRGSLCNERERCAFSNYPTEEREREREREMVKPIIYSIEIYLLCQITKPNPGGPVPF